jgi:hypothetical protein
MMADDCGFRYWYIYHMPRTAGTSFFCSLTTVEAWRLYHLWDELRRLLAFLDRLPLRRTMAALRGFSWGSVWKMSGNVLEVRYKVISRQMVCMNLETSDDPGCKNSLDALLNMRMAGGIFAKWYSANYLNYRVGDLTRYRGGKWHPVGAGARASLEK